MKRVLITGGTGFIGYHLAKRLIASGVERIDIADNFSRGPRDTDIAAFGDKIKIHKCDLRATGALDPLPSDYDVIFHFAALLGVANVRARPYAVLAENVAMTVAALSFAARQKNLSRFVFASTSEVYAGTQATTGVPVPTPEDVVITVADPHEPRSTYALSKIYGESLTMHSSLPFTIVRPHNVYGPRMGQVHVIPELLARTYKAHDGDKLEVYSPAHTRTFCYVDDAVELIRRAAQQPEAAGEFLNVGAQTPEIRIDDLATQIIKVVGRNVKIAPQPPTPGSPPRRCPDMQKATRLLGYSAKTGLAEGLERTYAWYRERVLVG